MFGAESLREKNWQASYFSVSWFIEQKVQRIELKAQIAYREFSPSDTSWLTRNDQGWVDYVLKNPSKVITKEKLGGGGRRVF